MKQRPDKRNGVWVTPSDLFNDIQREFNLEVDVCAMPDNAKLECFFTPEDDGLSCDWSGLRCWMNPPYGRAIKNWVRKAAQSNAEIVVALLPARTDTGWFHDWVLPFAEVRFIRGRVYFSGTKGLDRPMFPSIIAVYRGPSS